MTRNKIAQSGIIFMVIPSRLKPSYPLTIRSCLAGLPRREGRDFDPRLGNFFFQMGKKLRLPTDCLLDHCLFLEYIDFQQGCFLCFMCNCHACIQMIITSFADVDIIYGLYPIYQLNELRLYYKTLLHRNN